MRHDIDPGLIGRVQEAVNGLFQPGDGRRLAFAGITEGGEVVVVTQYPERYRVEREQQKAMTL